MAERYQRLYLLPENCHSPGAPFLITAGTLVRDCFSGQCLVQLKLRSISSEPICSVRICLVGLSAAGDELCTAEVSCEGLNIARDENFGERDIREMTDPAVRSFRVRSAEAVFADGQGWSGDGAWEPLPAQDSLNLRLFDTEIVRQYRLETTDQSRFVPLDVGELWLCACGAVNHSGEACHLCGQTLEHCTELMDLDLLRTNKSLRLDAAAMQSSIEEARRRSRSTLIRRLLCIFVPLLLTAAAVAGFHYRSERRSALYTEAVALYDFGDYTGAVQLFDKLGNYRDSASYAQQARTADALLASYTRACKLMENGRWDDACAAFEELGDYKDSADMALASRYGKGLALIEDGSFDEAREVFRALGAYRDAQEIADHFYERLISEQVSLNFECGGPLTTTYRYDSQGRLAETTEHFSEYPNMTDRVSVYSYADDGSYSVLQNQVEMHYDGYGNYLGQGEYAAYTYSYTFYDDGSVRYWIKYDAATGEQVSATSYDEHGNPDKFMADGSVRTIRNDYDGDLLIKQESYDENGTMLTRTSYEYDDRGRLKRSSFLTPGAEAAVTDSCTYGIVYVPESEE